MLNINILIFMPIIFSIFIPFSNLKFRNYLVILLVFILSITALNNLSNDTIISYNLPDITHSIFIFIDILLLSYFFYEGIRKKNKLVYGLAFVQLVLYSIILYIAPHIDNIDNMVSDRLSFMMYIIINIVGGLIVIYALKYIELEECNRFKKNSFIALLLFFIGVMNFIVTVNSVEMFFLAFELTTLCSYILIGFRKDKIAVDNSLRALWINQLGGVAILIALIFSITIYETIYFTQIIQKANDYILLPVVFLIIAGYVKGATLPFHNWLLGAMVAPTPVSAILHSATMVKIAPFLILKLSPTFNETISLTVAIFGSFVFVTVSAMALNKDFFKEILGFSTIALLSLMMALAALGTVEGEEAAMIILFFHAISKALLFLQAGVLEKLYNKKNISDIESLINIAPKTLSFIMIGFASLTLPPFGAFIGKFMAIEAIASAIQINPLNILVLLFLIIGSIFLTILYFKVAAKLLPKDIFKSFKKEQLPNLFYIPSLLLVFLLVVSIFFISSKLSTLDILIPMSLIFVLPFVFKINFKNATRVKEYNCGEKDKFEVSSYYFSISKKQEQILIYISFIFLILTIIGGL